MIVRRELILSGAAALLAAILPRHAGAADDPAGILTAIYTRVAKGKGDGGGTFVIQKAARTKYLSNSLVALWAKADARTRQPVVGPRPARRFIEAIGFKVEGPPVTDGAGEPCP